MIDTVDKCQLFLRNILTGNTYQIKDGISVYTPTIGEVLGFGEKKYYSVISALTCTPSICKVLLYDIGIDYQDISELEVFYLACNGYTPEDTRLILGDLDLSKFEMMMNKGTNELILLNPENGVIIDEPTYTLMADYLRKIHGFEKLVDEPLDEQEKQKLIEDERDNMKNQNDKLSESILSSVLNIL